MEGLGTVSSVVPLFGLTNYYVLMYSGSIR